MNDNLYLGDDLREKVKNYNKAETDSDFELDLIYNITKLCLNMLSNAEHFELKLLAMGGVKEYLNDFDMVIPAKYNFTEESEKGIHETFNNTIKSWAKEKHLTGVGETNYDSINRSLKMTIKLTW